MKELFDYLKTKKISVISPAGKINRELVSKSIAFFQEHGIQLNILPHVLDENSSEIYLASSLPNRLADFYDAWENSDIILCSRGGYGCAELACNVNWQNLQKEDTIVVGYSDVTALHMAMLKNRKGVCINGMMALKFPELSSHKLNCKTLLSALQGENDLSFIDNLNVIGGKPLVINEGTKFVAANLAVLSSLCGTSIMPDFEGKVLIVEDLNEPIYKLDRYLTQLTQNGILSQLDGLIFGEFINCGSAEDLEFVMKKFIPEVKGFTAKNFPFGHGDNIYSLRFC